MFMDVDRFINSPTQIEITHELLNIVYLRVFPTLYQYNFIAS